MTCEYWLLLVDLAVDITIKGTGINSFTPAKIAHKQFSTHRVPDMIERLEEVHELLQNQQMDVRQEDSKDSPLFQSGNLVLMQNVQRRKG